MRVAAEKTTERDKLPIGPDRAERVTRQDRVVANIVDFVLTGHGGGRIRAAQNHVGRGAAGRRGIWRDCQEGAVLAGGGAVNPDDLAHSVDAIGNGAGGQGTVDGGEDAPAIEEAVESGVV